NESQRCRAFERFRTDKACKWRGVRRVKSNSLPLDRSSQRSHSSSLTETDTEPANLRRRLDLAELPRRLHGLEYPTQPCSVPAKCRSCPACRRRFEEEVE